MTWKNSGANKNALQPSSPHSLMGLDHQTALEHGLITKKLNFPIKHLLCCKALMIMTNSR